MAAPIAYPAQTTVFEDGHVTVLFRDFHYIVSGANEGVALDAVAASALDEAICLLLERREVPPRPTNAEEDEVLVPLSAGTTAKLTIHWQVAAAPGGLEALIGPSGLSRDDWDSVLDPRRTASADALAKALSTISAVRPRTR